MCSFARGMLDDSAAGKVKLSQEEMALLDEICYYSEFHCFLTYQDSADPSIYALSNATNSSENDNALDDLANDMVSVVK